MLTLSAATAQETSCFKTREAPVFVLQQAPPPRTDASPSTYYPASAFATANIQAIDASSTKASLYYWQWANHGQRLRPKGNIIPRAGGPLQLVANFTSRQRADECTIAQTRAALGDTVGDAASLTFRPYSEATDLEQTDVCYLPSRLTREVEGIVLDYEVFDGRSADEASKFLVHYAEVVKAHARKVILYTNPLDAPSQARTGISDDNIAAIAAAYDLVTLVLWGGNKQSDVKQSFQSQQRMLGSTVTAKKGLITYELASTSMEDAQFVNDLLKNHSVFGINLWRNYARQGGGCETEPNRKIACVVYGRCN